MTRKTNNRSSFGYENLEARCLLAADIGFGFSVGPINPIVEIGSMQSGNAIHGCQDAPDPLAVESNGGFEDPTLEIPGNQLDLLDGSDGVFGTLDQENRNEQLVFVAPGNGAVNIIVSSSFGDAETSIEIRDEAGDMIVTSSVEELDGFYRLSLGVEAGELYELTLSAGEKGEGPFQITVQFEADKPVDIHADEIGVDATELDMRNGFATIFGNLEEASDVDVFQMTASESGDVNLFAGEMTEGNNVQLSVTVSDSEGNEIASGSTNEFVETSFDVEKGQVYYVSVQAGADQTGSYSLALQQDSVVEPPDESNVNAGDTTLLGFEGSFSLSHNEPNASNVNAGDTTMAGINGNLSFFHNEPTEANEFSGDTTLLGPQDALASEPSETDTADRFDVQFSTNFDGDSYFSAGFMNDTQSMEFQVELNGGHSFDAAIEVRDQSFEEFVEDDFFC